MATIPTGWIRQPDGSYSPPSQTVKTAIGDLQIYTKSELLSNKPGKHKPKSYNPQVVTRFFAKHGIPAPEFEYQFHPTRKWRFDLAWPMWEETNGIRWVKNPFPTAVEVDGGIWIAGGHNRGEQMKKDWEKANEAAALGWRILRCEPRELCTAQFAELIKRALGL